MTVEGTVPPTGAGAVSGAQVKAKRANAKLKLSRTLRVDRKGRVNVRVNCAGDAGATCRGTVNIVRGKATYGSKAFTVAAGKTATVKVTLRKAARAALKKSAGKAVKSTVAVSGKDSAGVRISARQAVSLK